MGNRITIFEFFGNIFNVRGDSDGDSVYKCNVLFLCSVKLTECENQRKAVEAFRSVDGANATDAYTPQCLPNGSYVDIQCHASKGLCWCVDEQGKELLGSKYESEMPECKRCK